MSNGNSQGTSIWPVVTVIVAVIALAGVGWDVMLQKHNKSLEDRLKKVELHLAEMDGAAKAAADAAAKARRKARAADSAPATLPKDKTPGK
jgi:acid phosphatase class B